MAKQQSTNQHEPGSLRDRTASLEPQGGGPTRDDAIAEGHRVAKENAKVERENSNIADAPTREETIEDAQETARLNHEAEHANQPEGNSDTELRNDTSKAAKVRTSKAQLDPAGLDPISDNEVERAATDASMETGNKTAVSNKEAANRSKEPGKAEENSPVSTANGGTEDLSVSDDIAHANRYQQPTKEKSASTAKSERKSS